MADFVLLLWGNLNNAGLPNQHLPCSEPGLVSRGYWIESQCKHLPFFSLYYGIWYIYAHSLVDLFHAVTVVNTVTVEHTVTDERTVTDEHTVTVPDHTMAQC